MRNSIIFAYNSSGDNQYGRVSHAFWFISNDFFS